MYSTIMLELKLTELKLYIFSCLNIDDNGDDEEVEATVKFGVENWEWVCRLKVG